MTWYNGAMKWYEDEYIVHWLLVVVAAFVIGVMVGIVTTSEAEYRWANENCRPMVQSRK